jgi:hypothetical protein
MWKAKTSSDPDSASIRDEPPAVAPSVQSDGYGSSSEHTFSDPATADRWRKVYEEANYENRHRFDPDYSWTAAEEKKLVRKVGLACLINEDAWLIAFQIDKRIILWAWIMFCALDLHRRNINRAISDNMVRPRPLALGLSLICLSYLNWG